MTSPAATRRLDLPTVAFTGHVVLIAASAVAFWLVVGRPPPASAPAFWGPAYAFGMQWFGVLYIILGFVAAAVAWVRAIGARPGVIAIGAVLLLSLGAELCGTTTGWPFGPYGYGTLLGPRAFGRVPWVIPLSWFFMLYASLGIAARAGLSRRGTAVLAALGLLAWDVPMDPAMSAVFPFWTWDVEGVFYGMPLINWFGWMLTGWLLAAAVLAIVGDRSRALARGDLPLRIYVVNGLFPMALALRDRLYGVVLLGVLAMGLYLLAPRIARASSSGLVVET